MSSATDDGNSVTLLCKTLAAAVMTAAIPQLSRPGSAASKPLRAPSVAGTTSAADGHAVTSKQRPSSSQALYHDTATAAPATVPRQLSSSILGPATKPGRKSVAGVPMRVPGSMPDQQGSLLQDVAGAGKSRASCSVHVLFCLSDMGSLAQTSCLTDVIKCCWPVDWVDSTLHVWHHPKADWHVSCCRIPV